MPNIFKNQEQRDKWNKYNNAYSKKNYKTMTLKLNRQKDKDIIDYVADQAANGVSLTEIIRTLIRSNLNK